MKKIYRIPILCFCGGVLVLLGLYLSANHNFLTRTLRIAGSEENSIATTSLNNLPNIEKTPRGLRPTRDKLIALLKPNDPDSIFLVVDTIAEDPNLSLNCHEIAHDIGHRAYEMYGFSDAMTFDNPKHVKHALVQYICAGGYMHGILEEMSLHHPEFLQHPDTICDTVPTSDRASCFHGMGHVYMLAHARDAEASISGCRLVSHIYDRARCFEGVRMEQFWGIPNEMSTSTLGWDIEKPVAACVGLVNDEKPTCFLYSSFGYLKYHPKDYAGAVRLCTENNLDDSNTSFCLKGLGITMMSKFKGQHLEDSEVYVTQLSYDQKYAFYLGVLGYARLSGVSKSDLETTCSLFKVDSGVCLAALTEK